MTYRETLPHPHLRAWVSCYWELEGNACEPQIIYPDGRSEIVFHLADPFEFAGTRQPAAIVAGQLTGPIEVRPLGCTRVFGMRFAPAGAWALLRFKQREASNQILPADDICATLTGAMRDRLADARGTEARSAIANSMLLERAPTQESTFDLLSRYVAEGSLSSREARSALCATERTWERLFAERVGIPPKMLERIARFRRAMRLASKGSTWIDISLRCGYADQAHLIRDFSEFTGASPTRVESDLFG